ncbi:MAG TPA: DEAD/DEAH box helicase [Bacteroidales bacterium]|nr:DEAD/DEAH box helicase [Bacteroidales bacterium]
MITFSELQLDEKIIRAIEEMGFVNPTPIQEQVIPALLESAEDIVALAQTGTGKTAAFGLPILEKLDYQNNSVQALILCPTRELCLQITNDIENYSKYLDSFRITAVYGGASIENQVQKLKKGSHIVVGTPGRTLDLIKRKALKISNIRWLILDEADEMLDMGFKDDLDDILSTTPQEKRVLLFSATMPKDVAKIAQNYMKNSREISVGKKNSGAENISHIYYMVNAGKRYEVLKRIADINPNIYGIVFCRTRMETKEIADKLISDGYNADALHGDLSQAQRDMVMGRFRSKLLQLLVATDVAARGIDVNDLTHIINYNLPDELEAYIHRSGRTGRAGKSGYSISIVHTRENNKIRELEKITGKTFKRKPVPIGTEICERQLFNLIDKVEKIEVNETQIEQYLPAIYKKLDWLDREELIKHFVSVEFNRFLEYYKNAPDLNVKEKEKRRDDDYTETNRRERKDRSKNRNDVQTERNYRKDMAFSRFFINLGSRNSLNPHRLMGLINDCTRTRGIEIGKIDIMKGFSFFEVDSSYEDLIIKTMNQAVFDKIRTVVEISKPDSKTKEKKSFTPEKFKKKSKRNKY